MAEILLRCRNNNSDKEYRFELDPTDPLLVQKYSGPTGNCNVSQGSCEIGTFQGRRHFESFVSSKMKKGYQVILVNGKPWMGGGVSSLVSAFVDGFNQSSQAPIGPKAPREPVPVGEFEDGSVAPVW